MLFNLGTGSEMLDAVDEEMNSVQFAFAGHQGHGTVDFNERKNRRNSLTTGTSTVIPTEDWFRCFKIHFST